MWPRSTMMGETVNCCISIQPSVCGLALPEKNTTVQLMMMITIIMRPKTLNQACVISGIDHPWLAGHAAHARELL